MCCNAVTLDAFEIPLREKRMKGTNLAENISSKDVALVAARVIDEKKGTDIVIQDVAELLNITDYFVICTAANNRRADSIAEEVEKKIKEEFDGLAPISIEGLDEAKWILMDYGFMVVHIFQPADRDYYRLEQLWDEAPTVDVAAAGIEDPVYTERIALLLNRQQ